MIATNLAFEFFVEQPGSLEALVLSGLGHFDTLTNTFLYLREPTNCT